MKIERGNENGTEPCFPVFLTPHSTQRLRFVGSLADIVSSTNLLTYLLT